MSDEIEYLYGYGRKKHIKAPDSAEMGWGHFTAACGAPADDEAATLRRLGRFNGGPGARGAMQRRRELPLCKNCAKSAAVQS